MEVSASSAQIKTQKMKLSIKYLISKCTKSVVFEDSFTFNRLTTSVTNPIETGQLISDQINWLFFI